MAKSKKLTVGLTIAGLIVGGVIGGLWADDSGDVKILNEEIEDLNADLDLAQTPVIETVEVEVDNGNLDLVLEHIYDNDGSVEYLTEDLDDDQVAEIVDKIVFVNEIRDAAVKAVRAELYDEVDKFGKSDILGDTSSLDTGFELYEDELTRLRINDDADELGVTITDWEDREATVTVTGTFRQGTDNFAFSTNVVFEDGEFDDLEKVNVRLVTS